MTSPAAAEIKNGDVSAALASLQESIRNDPADASLRIFLFQLLCIQGEWQRALVQLNVAADLDNEALLMAQTYRELLQCENYRAAVFDGNKTPLIFGEPPAWTVSLLQGLEKSANDDSKSAKAISEAAFEQAPARSGTLDGQSFAWLCDADMRIGPAMEAVINGKYYWVPFESIDEVAFSLPEDLRDLVWLPVEFKWTNGGESVAFVPTRYPGEDTLDSGARALARKTEWRDLGDDYYVGSGQRTFASDSGDHPMLETRILKFDPVDD
ncbi:MAG: virulence protein SciE type [Granulosicoccus sp.]|nr:virulence protein SciE type [Granulosicoccus sp.]